MINNWPRCTKEALRNPSCTTLSHPEPSSILEECQRRLSCGRFIGAHRQLFFCLRLLTRSAADLPKIKMKARKNNWFKLSSSNRPNVQTPLPKRRISSTLICNYPCEKRKHTVHYNSINILPISASFIRFPTCSYTFVSVNLVVMRTFTNMHGS